MSGVKETEAGKRKQVEKENDAVSGTQKKKKKARTDNEEETAVTDAEVDEFFAIIRRIHVAVNYIKNSNGDGRKLTDRSLLLEWERNVDGNAVKGEVKRGEEKVGLDLNADPGPE